MKTTGKLLFKIIFFASLLLAFPVTAQVVNGEPAAIIVYADDEFELEVYDAAGTLVDAYIGMELLEGDSIRTNNTSAELQLEPNGSILKLSEATSMKIDGFQRDVNSSNDISLLGGKLRAVAAKTINSSANYNIFTQSAVCGVRGTDFVIGAEGKLVVAEGQVEFIKSATGESLQIAAGMAADALAESFAAIMLTAEQLAQEFQSFQFKALDPANVPGNTPPAEEPEAEEEEAEEEEEEVVETADTPAVPVETVEEAPAETVEPREPGPLAKALAPLGDMLGMEIGSITVDGRTYSKMLFQPTFSVGKLQAALYLPIIYETNVFDPDDWYKPAGNNEWSFGTDQDGVQDIITDAAGDLFLKIRYLKWGEQRDPFYFKFGNLNDMSIGHGIIMSNYANDADFPALRKVGLNMGSYGDSLTLELVADDLSKPQIFGTRIGFKPVKGFPFTLGFSAVADINPDQDLPLVDELGDPVSYGDPIFLNPAIDFDLALFENDLLSFILFADAAALLPIVDGQAKVEYIYNDSIESLADRIQNYGAMAGLFGNILMVDYKLEYRYALGQFRPGFYNSTYDRLKGQYLLDVLSYLDAPAPTTKAEATQGIYGSVGMEFAGIFDLTGGYYGPWDEGGYNPAEDYFHLKLTLKPDVIPVVGLHGSLTYDRTGLVDSIQNDGFKLIDANTVFKGELIYPIAPTLDIALLVSSALARDNLGNVEYDTDGNPRVYNSLTIDTRVHF
jgi:hypothetical protein